MPLPPEIDPFGLSYEGPFDDAPPWPPLEWQEPIAEPGLFATPLTDDVDGAPVAEQLPLPPLDTPLVDPLAGPAPLTDELGGAPDPFALPPRPMPWETQPGELEPSFDVGPRRPGVRDLPGLAFYEHKQAPQAPEPFSYLTPGDPTAPLPSMRAEQAVDPFAPLSDQQGFAVARALPPERLLELEGQREYLRQKQAVARSLALEDENISRIEEHRKMREAAASKADADTHKIIADAQAIADKGIDRKAWFSDMNAAGKIGAVVGALTGGLMSKAGGPNYGIDFIDKLVDADIKKQTTQIGMQQDVLKMRQGAVAEAYKRSGDMFMAAETARLATYSALVDKLKTEQQNFDPRGTMFLNHGKAMQQMQARAAVATQKIEQQNLDNRIKEGEFELKKREFAAKQAKIGAAAGAAAKGKMTPAQIAQRYPGMPVPNVDMTEKEYDQFLTNREKGADIAKKDLATAPAERARELGVPGVVDDQGQQVLFRDAKTAGELGDLKASAATVTRLLDQIDAARTRHGWSSNLLKSDEWRQIKSDFKTAQVVMKEVFKLGVIAGPDMDIIEGAMGTSDPTEVRDPRAGLANLRKNVVNITNDKFASQAALPEGRALQRWEPAKLVLPEARATPEDKLLAKRSTETLDDVVKREVDAIETERGFPLDMSEPSDVAAFRGAYQAAQRKFDPSTSVDQRAKVESLAAAARGGDVAARTELEAQAKTSDAPAIRKLAKAALDAIDSANAPAARGPRSAPVDVPDALRLDRGL